MPIYPTLAVAAAVVVVAAGALPVPLRAVPRAGLLDLDGHLLRLHDPGRRWLTKHSAPIVIYRPRRHQRHLPDLGHPRWRSTSTPSPCSRWSCSCGTRLGRRRAAPAGRMRGMNPVVLVVGAFVGDGGRELRRPPLGDARRRASAGTAATTRRPRPLRGQRPLPGVLLRGRRRCSSRSAPSGLGRCAVVGRRRRHRLRGRLPLRPRGLHPPPPPGPLPRLPYLEWLRDAHRVHHRTGGEPYGMLLPARPPAVGVRPAPPRTRSTRPPAVPDRAASGGRGGVGPGRGCSAGSR